MPWKQEGWGKRTGVGARLWEIKNNKSGLVKPDTLYANYKRREKQTERQPSIPGRSPHSRGLVYTLGLKEAAQKKLWRSAAVETSVKKRVPRSPSPCPHVRFDSWMATCPAHLLWQVELLLSCEGRSQVWRETFVVNT